MSTLAIELNDAGIRAARSGEQEPLAVDGPHRASPGCAWLGPGGIVTGVAAARRASLEPLGIDQRFWDRLDTEPANAREPRSPNRAEVACAHLQLVLGELRREGGDGDVVIAVPAFYDRRQLGFLAGIARELAMPLRALVAMPVAVEPADDVDVAVIVELHLQRATVAVVAAGRGAVAVAGPLGAVRVCPDAGLHALRRRWMSAVGEEFVRATRFDPLHEARSEQQLQDRLPEILDALAADGAHRLAMEAGSRLHEVTLTERRLAEAGQTLVFRLCDDVRALVASDRPGAILLGHEAARVPGLRRTLEGLVAVPVRVLDPAAAALGLARSWPGRFETPPASGGGVPYYVRRDAERAAG